MLISYKYNFIFIHVYKVAGTSMHKALLKYLSPSDLLKTLPFPTHIKARDIKDSFSAPVYHNFFTFAFVRNPWDWQVSLYEYMLGDTKHYQHNLVKWMNNFEEYVNWRVNQNKHLQKDFVTSDEGDVIVDFIGRFENVENDFKHVCEVIGIKEELPHLNRSRRGNYKDYYNEKTKNLIYEYHKEDIEFFGYYF